MAKQHLTTAVNEVYLVDGARSPFIKARGKPGPFSGADLATQVCRQLLARLPLSAEQISEVIVGSAVGHVDETNVARVIALRAGLSNHTPAWTVQRNCASGLQALDCAMQAIQLGRSNIVLAGGTDAMSQGPILYNERMVNWLASLAAAKTLGAKAKTFGRFRPAMLKPIIGLLRGLTDPICGLSMGQTAEIIAYDFGISRADMDQWALQSHQRLALAQQEQHLQEIVPLYDTHGHAYQHDEGLRADTTLEKLAKLKPAYDKPFGSVTAGNSSQISDGAAFLVLANRDAIERHQLPVLAKVIDVAWGALNPAIMGLGPVHAMVPLLQRQQMRLSDIDYFEINEAFAGQVLGCAKALASAEYCHNHFGTSEACGELPLERLNIDGGAIALGHPIGATGARIALHLAHTLKRQQGRYGIASLCIGGGQGGAMLIEAVDTLTSN